MDHTDCTNFWHGCFASDEANGLTVRIGKIRCAPVNEHWACLRDGDDHVSGAFDRRQDAVDWMLSELLLTIGKQLLQLQSEPWESANVPYKA